jgi:hypothetical protein
MGNPLVFHPLSDKLEMSAASVVRVRRHDGHIRNV